MNIEQLYQKLADMESENFYQIESDFCAVLSCSIPKEGQPPCVVAFLTVANWFAMSQQSGVWTFYEAWSPEEIEITLEFLKKSGHTEFACVFASGIHDYQNACYKDDFDYPEEWISESEKIDEWIEERESWLYKWEQNILLDNKPLLCSL